MEEEIEETIKGLEKQLTGDMLNDMALKDEIHNLQMVLNGVKPEDSHIDCGSYWVYSLIL